jgi:hypothetical protein
MIQDLYNLSKHVASSDTSRYHLNGVQVDKHSSDDKKRVLVATDGHIMGVIKCDSDLDIGFYHSDVIKTAYKMSELDQDYSAILKPDAAVKFPKWQMFNATWDKTLTHTPEKLEPVLVNTAIAFNPDLLSRIKKGLGLRKAQGVEIIMRDPLSAVRVNCSDTTRHGVMMPMRAL